MKLHFLELASKIALPTSENDPRNFWLGAIGIRKDGAIVVARNGAVFSSTVKEGYKLIPDSHAECRAVKKMDVGGILYVARVLKKDKSIAMSSPCEMCRIKIKAHGICKVYYTVNPHQYGIWYVQKDIDKIFSY